MENLKGVACGEAYHTTLKWLKGWTGGGEGKSGKQGTVLASRKERLSLPKACSVREPVPDHARSDV